MYSEPVHYSDTLGTGRPGFDSGQSSGNVYLLQQFVQKGSRDRCEVWIFGNIICTSAWRVLVHSASYKHPPPDVAEKLDLSETV